MPCYKDKASILNSRLYIAISTFLACDGALSIASLQDKLYFYIAVLSSSNVPKTYDTLIRSFKVVEKQ